MLDHDSQMLMVNAFGHEALMAGHAARNAVLDVHEHMTRPSVLYRPALSVDGNEWCALYGADLQSGVAGFGESPAGAMRAFDEAWFKDLPGVKVLRP